MDDLVAMLARCFDDAAAVVASAEPALLAGPTPCREWNVQDLIDHMGGSTEYLLAATEGRAPAPRSGVTARDYRTSGTAALEAVRRPGATELRCQSPIGFEWSVGEAMAGVMMDTLVHTWDLATALGRPIDLDADAVDTCVAMFLPAMPEHGRAAGIVGPAVAVPANASPQDQLLGAMGRRP
jgi:uncharacterized protein (TIGR03086 family)